MSDFTELFRADTPLIDVRAPIEFGKGAFPSSVNLPILSDEEREEVGICYRESGPDSARALGHRLVSGETKNSRITAWITFLEQKPNAKLYCFRGGLRSELAVEWIKQTGGSVERIEGGYKAMRQFLLDQFYNLPPLLVVSGKTGSGKTSFLMQFEHVIDLEGMANHRGSAFGGNLSAQPSQIDFENQTAIAFLKLGPKELLIEDEGRLIGRIHNPPPLQEKLRESPIVVLEESLDKRTENIFEEYIKEQWNAYQIHFQGKANQEFENYLLGAAHAIRKRLGGEAYQRVKQSMLDALSDNETSELHKYWIETLLLEYYDPMYTYQLSKKSHRVLYKGTATAASDWYRERVKPKE